MLRKGLTPRRVLVILYGVAALFGALSLLSLSEQSQVLGLVMIVFSLVTWIGIQQLGYSEFADLQRFLKRSPLPGEAAENAWLDELRQRLRRCRSLEDLWAALVRAGSELGLDRLELELAEPSKGGAAGQRLWVWQAVGTGEPAQGGWSWKRNLGGRGGVALGELKAVWGVRNEEPRLPSLELLEAVAAEVADAAARVSGEGVAASDGETKVLAPGRLRRLPTGPPG